MRLGSVLRGQHFGNLAKISGIVTYKLSPLEQKAFAGAISHGVPNMVRRIRSEIFLVAPPILFAYMLYSWAEAKHHALSRKNPKDYENDQ